MKLGELFLQMRVPAVTLWHQNSVYWWEKVLLDVHWSAIRLKPLTGEVNNSDNIRQQVSTELETAKMGKCKNRRDFDKG